MSAQRTQHCANIDTWQSQLETTTRCTSHVVSAGKAETNKKTKKGVAGAPGRRAAPRQYPFKHRKTCTDCTQDKRAHTTHDADDHTGGERFSDGADSDAAPPCPTDGEARCFWSLV